MVNQEQVVELEDESNKCVPDAPLQSREQHTSELRSEPLEFPMHPLQSREGCTSESSKDVEDGVGLQEDVREEVVGLVKRSKQIEFPMHPLQSREGCTGESSGSIENQ